MYRLTDAVTSVLAGHHTAVARLVSLAPDLVTELRSWELTTARMLDGRVTADRRRDVRRDASLRLSDVDGTLAPASATDPLAEGAGVRIDRGPLIDGVPAWVPLITGYVSMCQTSWPASTIDLAVESPMSALAQEAGEGFVLPAGTFVPDALQRLWSPVLPYVSWLVDPFAAERAIAADVPVLPPDDRLHVGRRLALAAGIEAFDDRLGRIVVRVRPDPTNQAPVCTLGRPLTLARRLSRRPANRQAVEGSSGEDEPVFVVEEVEDPGSPIHRDRIGLRAAPTVRTDAVGDPATLRATARMWLTGRAMAGDTLTVTMAPQHLDLDEGDVVERTVVAPGRWRIDAITTPILQGTMSTTESVVRSLWFDG